MNNSHEKSSINEHIIHKIPIIDEDSTIKDALLMLEKISNKYDSVDNIFVLDQKDNLIGLFDIQELFNKPKNTLIKKIMQKKIITVSLDTEIEKVAHIALKHNLKQIPVTRSKKLIGVVATKDILSTINQSLKRDIFHFAGIHKSHLDFENSMEIPLFKAVKNRLSWIILGLMGAIIMALYIGLFEETLRDYMIIASFVPAIVYISDALGTQFQTVFVRDLAILGKELNIKKYFLKQMNIGFVIACIISILMFCSIFLIWKIPHIAFIISLASFITLIVTSFFALLITLLIKKFKWDPAMGSGPIATIISDMTSIVIYFIIVVLFI